MIEEKINTGAEIKIVCAGDSHTYGEGASDCFKEFTPKVAAGDLRKPNLTSPSYVNLLRNYFNIRTGSRCFEIYYNSPYLQSDISFCADGSVSPLYEGSIKISVHAREISLQMKCGKDSGKANIYIDGNLIESIDTSIPLLNNSDYNIYTFDGIQDETHEVIIENAGDKNNSTEIKPVYFFKLEGYSGQCVTINSGVGSCNSSKYLNRFFKSYVLDYNPDYLVLEAFSVNDWLAGTPLDIYEENLANMISVSQKNNCEVILLTVSPLLRARYPNNKIGIHYDEYIDASRRAAKRAKIKTADANSKMQSLMKVLMTYENIMHVNNAHVNGIGHLIYFESILDALDLVL